MRGSRLLAVAAMLLPLPFLTLGMNAVSDALARRAAHSLDRVARVIAPAPHATAPEIFIEPEIDAVSEPLEVPSRPARSIKAKRVVPAHGIRVRAETVLRIANAGSRPSGIPVPARGNRPAGLALVGVSGLGVGLVDGDVLVSAGGRPAKSVADVVGAVIGARSAHASEICGRFWRNGEPWNLVVEQPYVSRKPSPEAATGAVRVARRGF
jgi:hypothetical protein